MFNYLRIDKLLSAWIVVYSIFYILHMVPYNPIILLILAFLFTIISSIYIYVNYVNTDEYDMLILYIIINCILKLIPILIIIQNKLNKQDIIFTWIFLLIYFIYMTIMQENIVCTYKDLILFIMGSK